MHWGVRAPLTVCCERQIAEQTTVNGKTEKKKQKCWTFIRQVEAHVPKMNANEDLRLPSVMRQSFYMVIVQRACLRVYL